MDAEPGFEVLPGQTVSSPWLILGLFDGTLGDRPTPCGPTWRTTGPAPHLGQQRPPGGLELLVRLRPGRGRPHHARRGPGPRFGVEAFYVDYGWEAALGDWTPHPQRFPGRALRQLRDEVRRLGMRFGLWVAFGVADRDPSSWVRHPDFVARQPEPARTGIDRSIPALPPARLDKGELPHRARLRAGLAQVRPAHDRRLPRPGHGHDTSVGSLQANTQALYDILRGLREDFPELFVESTFDGAGYLDYGLYARSHTAWTTPRATPRSPCGWCSRAWRQPGLPPPLHSSSGSRPVGDGAPARGTSPRTWPTRGAHQGGGWGSPCAWATWTRPRRRPCAIWCRTTAPSASCSPGPSSTTWRPLAVPAGATAGPQVDDWLALQYVQPDLGRGPSWPSATAGARDRIAVRLRGRPPTGPTASPGQTAPGGGRPGRGADGARADPGAAPPTPGASCGSRPPPERRSGHVRGKWQRRPPRGVPPASAGHRALTGATWAGAAGGLRRAGGR